jgi:hypothetical protein
MTKNPSPTFQNRSITPISGEKQVAAGAAKPSRRPVFRHYSTFYPRFCGRTGFFEFIGQSILENATSQGFFEFISGGSRTQL